MREKGITGQANHLRASQLHESLEHGLVVHFGRNRVGTTGVEEMAADEYDFARKDGSLGIRHIAERRLADGRVEGGKGVRV